MDPKGTSDNWLSEVDSGDPSARRYIARLPGSSGAPLTLRSGLDLLVGDDGQGLVEAMTEVVAGMAGKDGAVFLEFRGTTAEGE